MKALKEARMVIRTQWDIMQTRIKMGEVPLHVIPDNPLTYSKVSKGEENLTKLFQSIGTMEDSDEDSGDSPKENEVDFSFLDQI